MPGVVRGDDALRMRPEEDSRKAQLTVYYVFLVIAVAVVTFVVVRAGEDKKAQPSIAGGYDLQAPNDCIGTPPAPRTGKPLPGTAPPQAQVAGRPST